MRTFEMGDGDAFGNRYFRHSRSRGKRGTGVIPILAIITVQKQVATGILFIFLFAAGHCLPIVVAGSSTAAVRRLVENAAWQEAGGLFRKGAGALIGFLGIYFIFNSLIA